MLRRTLLTIAFLLCGLTAKAQPQTTPPIEFTQETLDNGLRVIYAPLHSSPVVHVRVLYHVGSKNERPDRQGFAHMFEHMMFRGSAHVKPEEHMKLIGMVGGYSNAFTSFDETVYVNTIPSNHLEMALYLEADRMSSFKVSPEIYKTERKVVAEEWRMGQNKPYGTLYMDLFKSLFGTHSYQWTPIGNMEHLKAAQVNELQDFFNTYYVPNNAVLVVAGDFETDAAKALVHKYYAWIPQGAAPTRNIPVEPGQTVAKSVTVPQRVPLPAVVLAFKTPAYQWDDHYALSVLAEILGGGRSSRLQPLLVTGKDPQCVEVSASEFTLEDSGIFYVHAIVMQGKDPAGVEKTIREAVAKLRDGGVTPEELAKAKAQVKVEVVKGRETADKLATQLGDEALYTGDPYRANRELSAVEALTVDDLKAAAAKFLQPQMETTLTIKPDPLGTAARAAATQAAETVNAPVAAATRPIETRVVEFPAGYPTTPPMADARTVPEFKKGTELTVNGVKVIVMTDNRLPLVAWNLTMRHGSHSVPPGLEGLAGIASEMLSRGTKSQAYEALSQDLESRGISIAFHDGGDYTRLTGNTTTDQLAYGFQKSGEMLLTPAFDSEQFANVKNQLVNELVAGQESPGNVAQHDLDEALYGSSVLGRYSTPQSVTKITLDDVKKYYDTWYKPNEAVLIISGDVTAEKGKELAEKLLSTWKPADKLADVDYTLPAPPAKRKLILVDRPDAKGVTIQMGIRAYDIHTEEKFAGSLAGQILTAGIDSRLGRYVRAEKGLVYGIHGVFMPGRHEGMFTVGTETRPDAAGETITAAFKVLDDMKAANVTDKELSEAKLRVTGGMAMKMQTIGQQAEMRVEALLNGYPIDYYDKYPTHISAVTADQIKAVMNKYVKDDAFVIVVVAPAAAVKAQLEKLGDVEVRPMPAERNGGKAPSKEMLKPAT